MGSYLGCCTKSTPITAVDEPSKGLKIRGRIVERPAVPNDLWSTDTCEIDDDGEIHSMKNISSVRTSIQVQNRHGTAGTSNSFEYVNHGLLLWNQTRQKWVGSKKPDHRRRSDRPVVSPYTIYESFVLNNEAFQKHIPLTDMVHFLGKVWEREK